MPLLMLLNPRHRLRLSVNKMQRHKLFIWLLALPYALNQAREPIRGPGVVLSAGSRGRAAGHRIRGVSAPPPS